MCGLREEAPEKNVHGAGEAGDVQFPARAGQRLQELKDAHDAAGGPVANLALFFYQRRIGERGLLPGAVGAEIAEIVGERTGEQFANGRAEIGRGLRLEIQLA